MKTYLLHLVVLAGLVFNPPLRAEDAKSPAATDLQAKFKETMTAATMAGRWCPLKDGVLGEEKEDRYDIVSVEKGTGDDWIINARMKRGEREFVAPIPVQVKWAGDTAVIVVDELRMPGPSGYGGTTYSARVLVHGNTYAGTWSGGNHAGLLKGVITKAAEAKPETK